MVVTVQAIVVLFYIVYARIALFRPYNSHESAQSLYPFRYTAMILVSSAHTHGSCRSYALGGLARGYCVCVCVFSWEQPKR